MSAFILLTMTTRLRERSRETKGAFRRLKTHAWDESRHTRSGEQTETKSRRRIEAYAQDEGNRRDWKHTRSDLRLQRSFRDAEHHPPAVCHAVFVDHRAREEEGAGDVLRGGCI